MTQQQQLRAELLNDPASLGYAQHIPHAPGALAEALNAQTAGFMRKTRFVVAWAILAELEDGAQILDAMDAAAPSNSRVRWAMELMRRDPGIDVGHPRMVAMIDALQAQGALTAEQANHLRAMSVQPASRAEIMFGVGTTLTEADVRAALEEEQ